MNDKYKRGDPVTFRLSKKLNFNDCVIDFLNAAGDKRNIKIIKAIEFYCKNIQSDDKTDDATQQKPQIKTSKLTSSEWDSS